MNWKFWKKDDPLADLDKDFGADLSTDFSTPSTPAQSSPDPFDTQNTAFSAPMPQMPSQPAFSETPVFGQQPTAPKQDSQDMRIELVLARLDSIRNQLETLNQRVANIERLQLQQPQQQQVQQRGPWYQGRNS